MNMLRVTLFLLLVAVGAGAADISDFIVNDDGGRAEQNYPRIAVGVDGSFVITWIDKRFGGADVFAQRFDTQGNPLGGNMQINDDTVAAWQAEPAIAADLSGICSIVWKDYRTGSYPFDPGIYYQHLDSLLLREGPNVDLTSGQPDSLKESPDISLSQWGTGVVVWADYRNRNWDIYGQRIADDGTLIGGNFRVNSDVGAAQQHHPRVSVASSGSFVVAWYDNRFGDDDVFVQKFDSSGSPVGSNLFVNVPGDGTRQAFPAIATDGAGGFTVAWVDWRNGAYPANPDIYYRRYDSSMAAMTLETVLNHDNSFRAQKEPAIAVDRMGLTTVVWADSNTAGWDISGRLLDAAGDPAGASFTANRDVDSIQFHPDVAVDGYRRYVTWADKRNGNFDIYASVTQYNEPTLTSTPSLLTFEMFLGGSLPAAQTLVVEHEGLSALNYEVSASHDWMAVSPGSGRTPDSQQISIVTDTLSAGSHLGGLTLIGSDTHDSSVVIPVRLNVLVRDTITLGTVNVPTNQPGQLPIEVKLANDVTELNLPLKYDTMAVIADSVVFVPGLPGILDRSADVQASSGRVLLSVSANQADTFFAAGEHLLAVLHFTSRNWGITGSVDTAVVGGNHTFVVTSDGDTLIPAVIPGEIVVGVQTGVEVPEDDGLPADYLLAQNYPNPFNLSTVIDYELPRSGEVLLEVYNILGQRVRVLFSGRQSAGRHQVVWDGLSEIGHEVPSGIYFYRMATPDVSRVRKMALVK